MLFALTGVPVVDIIDFLCLHFPYFNSNRELCETLVGRTYDVNLPAGTFRLQGALIQRIATEININVEKYRY